MNVKKIENLELKINQIKEEAQWLAKATWELQVELIAIQDQLRKERLGIKDEE